MVVVHRRGQVRRRTLLAAFAAFTPFLLGAIPCDTYNADVVALRQILRDTAQS
jgi:hypothetical protein